MKNFIRLIVVIITISTTQISAYTVCNRSQMPITVIVCQTQDKAIESLHAMGWQGSFPKDNQTLTLPAGKFNTPTIYEALHWLIEPGKCGGTNTRDLEKSLYYNEKPLTTPSFFFMIFESFDKTGSSAIHFLTSGWYSIDATINFPFSAEKRMR